MNGFTDEYICDLDCRDTNSELMNGFTEQVNGFVDRDCRDTDSELMNGFEAMCACSSPAAGAAG